MRSASWRAGRDGSPWPGTPPTAPGPRGGLPAVPATLRPHGTAPLDVQEALMPPFDTVHGGVIAALFDPGLAVAIARRLGGEGRIATHNLNVSYVTFSRDRLLRCHARVVSLRTAVAIAEGEVVGADGALVAKALG